MFGRHWGRHDWPRERFFERGDLKYVILELLQEKPRHGYEVIRALEERFRGFYSPSPGVVYPTLQMLEDLGQVTVEPRKGKKVYTLTDEGRQFLVENRPAVDDIRARIGEWWKPDVRGEVGDLLHELRDLGRLFRRRAREPWPDAEKIRRVREVVARAHREIESILTEDRSRESPPVSL